MQGIADQLEKSTYALIPFSLDQGKIDAAITSFLNFLKLSPAVRSTIDFKLNPDHRRGDIGYKSRKEEDHNYNDEKEFFHFHPEIFTRYSDFIASQPAVADFLNQANQIWKLVETTILAILNELESDCPGCTQRVFHKGYATIILRFLKYEWQQSGKYLAKPHYDAGAFSLAIAEDCQGLRIGRTPETLGLVQHQPEQAIFFLSSNYQKVFGDHPGFYAGWHDVIQVNKELIGKSFARWAIVAFIEPYGIDAPPREETHKWFIAETI